MLHALQREEAEHIRLLRQGQQQVAEQIESAGHCRAWQLLMLRRAVKRF
jgi:hypothetical protein